MGLLDKLLGGFVYRRVAAYQNDLVEKHIAEVENIYRQMRGWRHDYHNHIQTLKAYRALGQDEGIDAYLSELDADLTGVDTLIKSGNVMVDAILNSKLSLAAARGIDINAKAVVPRSMGINEIDLCVVVGNLMDNAIEACMRVGGGARFIRLYMDVKRDSLYLSITNTSPGVNKRDGHYESGKGAGHGFGLMRVDRIVGKYRGYVKRRDEEGAFTAEVLLPVRGE